MYNQIQIYKYDDSAITFQQAEYYPSQPNNGGYNINNQPQFYQQPPPPQYNQPHIIHVNDNPQSANNFHHLIPLK